MKKALIFSCIIVLIFTLSVYAENGIKISTESVELDLGKESAVIDIPITISDNSGLCGLMISINYTEGLTVQSITQGNALPSLTYTQGRDINAKPFNILWDGLFENDTSVGTLATVRFCVPLSIVKDYDITVTVKDAFNVDMKNVNATVTNSKISVKDKQGDTQETIIITPMVPLAPTNPSTPSVPSEKEWKNPFSDVNENDWFYDFVEESAKLGLINGMTHNTFAPNTTLSRAMLVTILYRLDNNAHTDYQTSFSDVEKGSWYAPAVAWAEKNKIVNGVSKDKFAPDDAITREQIATILFRYAVFKGYNTSVKDSKKIATYSDNDKISSYAKDAMTYAVENGLINGETKTTLNPKAYATRAQTAAIIVRFSKLFNKNI